MPIDDAAAQQALTALIAALLDATAKGVVEGAMIVEGAAKTIAPVKTGRLRGSFRIEGPVRIGPASFMSRVGPTVAYGRIRELGGDIRPVRAKALRWIGVEGYPIFAQLSHQVPRPYLKPGVMVSKPLYRQLMRRRWAEAIRSV